jgi:hypothetical protein
MMGRGITFGDILHITFVTKTPVTLLANCGIVDGEEVY